MYKFSFLFGCVRLLYQNDHLINLISSCKPSARINPTSISPLTPPMTSIHDPNYSTPLLISSVLSLAALLVLFLLHFVKKISQHILASYFRVIIISDFIYTISGLLIFYTDHQKGCLGYIGAIRSYFRLVSIAGAFSLAWIIRNLAVAENEDVYKKLPWSHFFRIFLIPLTIVLPFRNLSLNKHSDVICWASHDLALIDKLPIFLPVCLAIGIIIWEHLFIIFELREKWKNEKSISVYDIRELFIYPLGLIACYIWMIFDDPRASRGSIRWLNVFFQQSQGLMHLLVYGLGYETRSYFKRVYKRMKNHLMCYTDNSKPQIRNHELQAKFLPCADCSKRLEHRSIEKF